MARPTPAPCFSPWRASSPYPLGPCGRRQPAGSAAEAPSRSAVRSAWGLRDPLVLPRFPHLFDEILQLAFAFFAKARPPASIFILPAWRASSSGPLAAGLRLAGDPHLRVVPRNLSDRQIALGGSVRLLPREAGPAQPLDFSSLVLLFQSKALRRRTGLGRSPYSWGLGRQAQEADQTGERVRSIALLAAESSSLQDQDPCGGGASACQLEETVAEGVGQRGGMGHVEAQLRCGRHLVDLLASRAGGAHKMEFELVQVQGEGRCDLDPLHSGRLSLGSPGGPRFSGSSLEPRPTVGRRALSRIAVRHEPVAVPRKGRGDPHSARTELLGSSCQQPGSPGWPQQVDPVETRIPRLRTRSLSLVRKGKGCLQFVIQLRREPCGPRESLWGERGEDMVFRSPRERAAGRAGPAGLQAGFPRPAYGLGRPAVRA